MADQRKDDNLSYRVKLLRDLESRPDAAAEPEPEKPASEKPDSDKPAGDKPDISDSLMENVSSDPYLAKMRSKYRPR